MGVHSPVKKDHPRSCSLRFRPLQHQRNTATPKIQHPSWEQRAAAPARSDGHTGPAKPQHSPGFTFLLTGAAWRRRTLRFLHGKRRIAKAPQPNAATGARQSLGVLPRHAAPSPGLQGRISPETWGFSNSGRKSGFVPSFLVHSVCARALQSPRTCTTTCRVLYLPSQTPLRGRGWQQLPSAKCRASSAKQKYS